MQAQASGFPHLFLILSLPLFLVAGFAANLSAQPVSDLTLDSDNTELTSTFYWAKDEILNELVVTHLNPLYIPAYWGAYRDREAFYSRDICHQVEGGHLLSLDLENFSMLSTFAAGATAANGYWPKWSYDFFGNPYFMDAGFKELPAPFEIVHRSWEQYLWTGDPAWINDPVMFDYYTNTVIEFMKLQDQNSNGVADEAKGLCTYWEFETDDFIEAGDSFGSQYQAYCAYARILEARGDTAGAALWETKAEGLGTYFHDHWYSEVDRRYKRGFRADGTWRADFGHENSFFMPMKLITDQGERTAVYMDYVHENIYNHGINIEAKTYLPELYYRQGQIAMAWHWHLNVMRSGSTYPEVAFLVIGNTVGGMMGVRPDAPNNKVYTVPRLNQEVSWVEVDHIPLGANDLKIRHEGQTLTELTNNGGPAITWEAQFYGAYTHLEVDGTPHAVNSKDLNGRTIAYIPVTVAPGQTRVVETVPLPHPGYTYLSDMDWTYTSSAAHTKKDVNAHSYILSVDNETFEKGLGVKANHQVKYDLEGSHFLFVAQVGVDDETSASGTASFEVWIDGIKGHDTGIITGADGTSLVAVDVQGVSELKLAATDGGDGGGEYADWAEARVYTWATPFPALDYVNLTGDGNSDGLLDPGETADINIDVSNFGVADSGNATITCQATGPHAGYVTVNTVTLPLGVMQPGQTTAVAHSITANPATPRGTPLELTFTFTDGVDTVVLIETFVTPFPVFQYAFHSMTNDDNGNGLLDPGESADLNLDVGNTGTGATLPATSTCTATGNHAGYVIVNTPLLNLGVIHPGASQQITHNISVDPATPEGTTLELTFLLDDGLDSMEVVKQITTPHPILGLAFVSLTSLGNGEPMIEAGGSSDLVILADNSGLGEAGQTALDVAAKGPNAGYVTVNTPHFDLGVLAPGAAVPLTVNFNIAPAAPAWTEVELTLTLSDRNGSVDLEKTFVVDVICLSDMNWTFAKNGYKELQRDRSNQGLTLKMEGVTYSKGLGLHANAEIRYDLGGNYTRFLSDVGVDDEVGPGGSVHFQVWLDGFMAFDSGLMKGSHATQTVDLDVTGVSELKLLVTEGINGIAADHGDWGFARLVADPEPAFSITYINITNDNNGDGLLDPGESADINVEVSNTGTLPTSAATLECTATGPNSGYVTVNTPPVNLGVINAGQTVAAAHNITIDGSTPAGTVIELTLDVSDGIYSAQLVKEIPVQAAELVLSYVNITGDDNNDGDLDGGETAHINVEAANVSPYPSGSAVVTCTATGVNSGYVTVNTPSVIVGVIPGASALPAAHSISVDAGIPDTTVIELTFGVTDGVSSAQLVKSLVVSNPPPPSGLYLSDMNEIYASQGWGTLQKDKSVDGNAITLQGTVHDKGLGTHAASDIRYALKGEFERFISDVGVDDETNSLGSVTFEVWADGGKRYESGVLTGDSPTQRVDLDMTGVQELKLIVTDGGDNMNWDHADWADARVIPAGPKPRRPSKEFVIHP